MARASAREEAALHHSVRDAAEPPVVALVPDAAASARVAVVRVEDFLVEVAVAVAVVLHLDAAADHRVVEADSQARGTTLKAVPNAKAP